MRMRTVNINIDDYLEINTKCRLFIFICIGKHVQLSSKDYNFKIYNYLVIVV